MSGTLVTILGIIFIFAMTSLGASFVLFFKNDISKKINSCFSGFASGVMIAASIWSLLMPAIEESQNMGKWKFIPAVVGFLVGCFFMVILAKIIENYHKKDNSLLSSDLKKSAKLLFAVTIHNIPEGLAVGFAFGAAMVAGTDGSFVSALGLAIGIGVQNIPEGTAVALPVREATGSRWKAFFAGIMSGAVEPIFAIIGFFLASFLRTFQPWLLAFSAGAMIFVVVEDLIPDAKLSETSHIGTWGFVIGFIVMMILDITL